jgi:hypothetical protein
MAAGDPYPRALRRIELDLLESVLPPDRPGYRRYRDLIAAMVVLAEGSRGPGNYILGYPGDVPDLSMPLAPVFAFGVVESRETSYTVNVRELSGNQIDVEILSASATEVPDHLEERGRWTYSIWSPGSPSPATGGTVREVAVDENLTLAIAPQEKRIWLHEQSSGMNHLLPVTNFHNELMLSKGIRDPKVALDVGRFFSGLESYSDADLREALVRYNAPRHRVNVHVPPPSPPPEEGLFKKLRRMFGKEKQ